uniref:Nuclear receptor coactivator 6 n=1 Tax=Poecilia formosa TaxID=48698 RepID=A0A096MHT3_POEFO
MNFVQSQVTGGTPGAPVATQQLQNQQMTHTGAQPAASTPNSMQGPPHVQPNIMAGQSSMPGPPPGTTAGASMGQQQPGLQTQMMGLQHQAQPVSSSPSQMVQGQGGGQTVLSRPIGQGQRGGMTPPKQMMPQQGQGVMHGQGQMVGGQGHQAMLPIMEQMVANQMQGNKQAFGGKIPPGVMPGQMMRGPSPNVPGNMPQFQGQIPIAGNPNQTMGMHGPQMRLPAGHPHVIGDPNSGTGELGVQQMVPDMQAQQQQGMMGGPQHMQMGNGHFPGHGMNFNPQFAGQMPVGGPCGQPGGFPVSKDVTLTSPLLVNLLQSDISASQFGPGGKQGAGGDNPAKPKKKKPPRKKKPKESDGQQQVEGLGGLDGTVGMEDADLPNLSGEQGLGLESSGQKLPDFPNRPTGTLCFQSQTGEQRVLQQVPMQYMIQMQNLQNAQAQQGMPGSQTPGQSQPQMHQQQQVHQQQQQQMMMMIKMQQESKNRMPMPAGGQLPPRSLGNPTDVQRHPVSQQGNMPVMINLQGHGGVPPSPDKARGMPLMVNPQLSGAARRMSHSDVGQGPQSSGSEEVSTGPHTKQDRPAGSEIGVQPGNGTQQMVSSQTANPQMMKQGPGQTSMPQHTGASPQQQLTTQPQQGGHMPGLHFPSVPTSSQSSRPKTPNRASPRPYHHPLAPTNRPPSTEPSEINLSPERLNASIAGLFPPKINIPLPPRQPNLNRGFDQQGLNPTTLKAIGQAPPSLTLPGNNNNGNLGGSNSNNQQSAGAGVGVLGAKQDKQSGGQNKRASPSNSRRSSPASSRKSATPSPGRQKATKNTMNCPPHQQQMVNPQGQTMMLSPSSVPQSPVSMPSQAGGAIETQQSQSSLHGIHGNLVDGFRENQGIMPPEQRPVAQPPAQTQQFRDLSSPRISPRMPAHQVPKPDVETQANTVDRPPTHLATGQDSEVSPALRAAPTSLNQLLDNANIPNKSLRPSQTGNDNNKSALDPDRPVSSSSQNADKSTSVCTNTNANPGLSTGMLTSVNTASSAVKPSPSPKPVTSVQSVIQIPASSSNISPNQITVFVTSNPITSAPTSQVPASMVSTMVAVPNKNIRPQDIRHQSSGPRPAQFITTTPVFINPIFQVPASSVAPNSGVVSQSVTMVGSLQVSAANIHLSHAPSSSQTTGATMTSAQSNRSGLGQVHITTSMSPSGPVSTLVAPQQFNQGSIKPETPSEASSSLKSAVAAHQPSPHPGPSASASFQPPLASPPPCSSPMAVRKSPVPPSPTSQMKVIPTSATVSVSGKGDSQQTTVERPLQGHTGGIPQQVFLHPANQTETQAPHTTVVSSNNNPPVVSNEIPSQVTVPPQIVGQAPAPVSVPNQPPPVNSQAPIATAVGSGVSSSALLSTVPPIQSSVTSVLPIVAASGPGEASHITSSSTGIPSAVPASQTDVPAAEPSVPPPPATPGSPRAAVEKPKGPSRRSSRAEKEAEEEPAVDSGIRKRSARPGTSAAVKGTIITEETAASPTQAKRRKSK